MVRNLLLTDQKAQAPMMRRTPQSGRKKIKKQRAAAIFWGKTQEPRMQTVLRIDILALSSLALRVTIKEPAAMNTKTIVKIISADLPVSKMMKTLRVIEKRSGPHKSPKSSRKPSWKLLKFLFSLFGRSSSA